MSAVEGDACVTSAPAPCEPSACGGVTTDAEHVPGVGSGLTKPNDTQMEPARTDERRAMTESDGRTSGDCVDIDERANNSTTVQDAGKAIPCGEPDGGMADGQGGARDVIPNSEPDSLEDSRISPSPNDSASEAVVRLRSGWLVDEPAQLSQLYSAAGLCPDRRLWRIDTPFLMDAQAARIAREMETGEDTRRRRRRPPQPAEADPVIAAARQLLAEHTANTAAAGRLLAEHAAEVGAGAGAGIGARPAGPSPAEYRQNNSTARQAAQEVLENSAPPLSVPLSGANPTDSPCLLDNTAGTYVLPPRSRFLCDDVTASFGDVTVVEQLLDGGPKFDCVLLDPPWCNKFVRRKRKRHERDGYQSLDPAALARLPIPQLAADGALVAVWCTNSSAHRRTLRETLLPAWGVREVAAWHWVKVTRYGQPVTGSTGSGRHQKQPYELLVFGRRGTAPSFLTTPPADQVIISTPCAVHSRKPLLHDLLRPYLPAAGYRGLEVFARGLQPGWTAWGDQPLLLQRVGALLVTRERAAELERADEEEKEQDRVEEEQAKERAVEQERMEEEQQGFDKQHGSPDTEVLQDEKERNVR